MAFVKEPTRVGRKRPDLPLRIQGLDMRYSIATFLLTTVCLAGCQQTAGVNTSGPLTPIGPSAPNTANGQASALNPFGAPTRVPPPDLGSYKAPNNYMGSGTTSSQGNLPVAGGVTQANPNANTWNTQPIGSGVQQASAVSGGEWSQTANGFVANPNLAPSADPPSNGLRSGGMQVIDLTGGPPPPGYHPPAQPMAPANQPAGNAAVPGSTTVPGYTPVPTNQPPGYAPVPGSVPANGYAPTTPELAPAPILQTGSDPNWRSPQVITAPSEANIATAPSTDPINTVSDQNLQWRSPQ